MNTPAIVIAPPVTGTWAIYNPPGHPALAYDFLAEDPRKSLYRKGNFLRHLVRRIPVEDTLTWGSPVYAPVDGTVVACHDTAADRLRICFAYDLVTLLRNKPSVSDGFAAFGGNHIMIQAEGCYVLLCHLKQGSVRVRTGAAVKVGEPIGEVGNSGSSIQPHLHLQVMASDRIFPLFANLLPFSFGRGEVRQGAAWTAQSPVVLNNRSHYRFAPPDGPAASP